MKLPNASQIPKGLEHLLGEPVTPGTPADRETLLKELLLIRRRRWELAHPDVNPYQHSFTRFRTELCWTRDAERAGRVELIPDYPYLRELDTLLMTKTPLLIAKPRRMLVTWTVLALDLWLIGGGQDPRWTHWDAGRETLVQTLMESTDNREVVIAARKLEDKNGSADFLARLGFMYQQFEQRGGREKWPSFPKIRFGYNEARASNGGLLSAVPQGKDQLAGGGYLHAHLEEFSRWSEQKASLASALQTTRGGAHLTLVATAQTGTHAANIALDKIKTMDDEPLT